MVICVVENKTIKQILDWRSIVINTSHAAIECAGIVVISIFVKKLIANQLLSCAIVVFVSCLSYIFLLVVFKNKIVVGALKYMKMKKTRRQK